MEYRFPSSYFYHEFSAADRLILDEYEHSYTTGELGYLTPEYSNIIDREVVKSEPKH